MDQRIKRGHLYFPADWQHVESAGVGAFFTRAVHRLADGSTHVWTSRRYRKGLGPRIIPAPGAPTPLVIAERPSAWLQFWAPARLAWWIAVAFMAGAFLFGLASALALAKVSTPLHIDLTYFIGSLFFTSAGYLQFLESINAGEEIHRPGHEKPPQPFRWFAWQPQRIDFWATGAQFMGTIAFNFDTFDALLSGLNWIAEDVLVWGPNMVGSILFLVASYLAILENCHRYWCWLVRGIAWWVVMINLLGSIAFMISAVFAFVLPPFVSIPAIVTTVVVGSTLTGAICFFLAAYLLLPEMFSE